jgi:DNA-binding HxlR family transcriptional regulator
MGAEDIEKVVGRKRTFEILDYLSTDQTRNFSEIEAEIDSSSDTVWQTLELLVDYGLIERQKRSEKDVRYLLTSDGEVVLGCLNELSEILTQRSE